MSRIAAVPALALATAFAQAGEVNDLISRQSASEQAATFRSIITSTGERTCRSVSRTFFMGTNRNGGDYFAVRCDNGTDYLVMIENSDGMRSSVVPCARLKTFGAECWEPF